MVMMRIMTRMFVIMIMLYDGDDEDYDENVRDCDEVMTKTVMIMMRMFIMM